MKPEQVRTATEIFSDVAAYICISSTHAYQRTATIPLKEGVTPLHECTEAQAVSDEGDTYGPRKAEGDRIIAEVADSGVNAMSVRPTAIYGPYDYTQRQDYWIDRVNNYDQIVVPGDEFRMPIHIGYVEDVARAIRLVAERGDPGEAYNVADRQHLTYTDFIGLIAEALDTAVEVFHAPPNVLSEEGLQVTDFSLCEPYPYYVSTEKLASLGWESTSYETGISNAVNEHRDSDRDGAIYDPGRETETDLISRLEGSGTVLND
jgi:nucleoside-diphosphate-sugar epimerase